MIQVKILKKADDRFADNDKEITAFSAALATISGHDVETVYEQEAGFDGFYLMPAVGLTAYEAGLSDYINRKTFLLGAFNTSIPDFIQEFQPAGLTNWMLFKDAKPSVIGHKIVIDQLGYTDEKVIDLNNGYGYFSPLQPDGSFETVAKAILLYLEHYDTYSRDNE